MAAKPPNSTESSLGRLVVYLLGDDTDLVKKYKAGTDGAKKLEKEVTTRVNAIKKASTLAVGAVVGVGVAISKLAAQATEIRKTAQAVGLASSEFLELNHAARQTGVTTETLLATFTRLNTTIAQANSQAITPTRMALDALGISLTNTTGGIRTNIEVFSDLADKFATFEDGAQKSALAVQLFGEQGVKLLPLLNQGSQGITKFAEEARRLGIALDDDVVDKAAEVDKEFKLLGDTLRSAGIKLAAEFLPAIKNLRDIVTDPTFQQSIGWITDKINYLTEVLAKFGRSSSGNIITDIQNIFMRKDLEAGIGRLTEALTMMQEARRNALEKGLDTSVIDEQIAEITVEITQLNAAIRALKGEKVEWKGGMPVDDTEPLRGVVHPAPTVDPEAVTRAQQEIDALREASRRALSDVVDDPTNPMEEKLKAITKAAKDGVIGFQEFGDTWKMVTDQNSQAMDDLLSATSSALTSIFKESKGAAIAAALINTYQGITRALSQYPPPIAQAMAAIQAAQGFAQVQAIRNTGKNGSGGGSASGAGAGAGSGGSSGGGDSGESFPRSLFVQGISPSQLYSGSAVRDLAEILLKFQADGGQVLFERT